MPSMLVRDAQEISRAAVLAAQAPLLASDQRSLAKYLSPGPRKIFFFFFLSKTRTPCPSITLVSVCEQVSRVSQVVPTTLPVLPLPAVR